MTAVDTLPAPTTSPSRRKLSVGLAAATTAAAVAQVVRPSVAEAATDSVLHLLRRATFGPTPDLVAAVRKQGASAWLEAQLSPTSVSDTAMDELLKRWPLLNLRTWECRQKLATETDKWQVMYAVLESHMARSLWSQRQLFEVTVNFWTNHLVIPVPTSEVWDCAHLFQRDVIRKYAFGKYADMLAASARHPAMLNILDNAMSDKGSPNENYARELLELHTVGLGNFSEADVKNAARVLTGLSVDSENGLYEYKPQRRYVGSVKVLGWSDANASPEGGEKVALSYLGYLARHPLTARRLATKLAVRFVSDAPPESLIAKLASVYSDNDTAIVPVLRALFTSAEFAASAGKKLRTPYEDYMATLRILGTQPESSGAAELRQLLWMTKAAGQAPMGWPAPNGYPDVAPAWSGASTTLTRWNNHFGLVLGWVLKGLPRKPVKAFLPATPPATYSAYLDALSASLCLDPLTPSRKAAVCTFLDRAPTDKLSATDAALGWRLPYVIALLLDSPSFAVR